jgi:signal transduction histidine kinase
MPESSSITPPISDISIPFWRRFRFNLIIFFVILAVIPLTLISFINISQQIEQAQNQVTEQLQSIVELKANQLDLWLDQGRLALDIILSNNGFRRTLVASIREPETITAEQRETLARDIRNFAQTNAYFERFLVYRPDGTVVYATIASDVGKVVTLQPYFRPSLQQREHLQAPFYDISTTELTMIATHHVIDDGGQLVAIIAGKISLTALGDIMTERTGLSASGETYLVSRQNSYLLTPSRFPGYERQRAYRSDGITRALNNQPGSGVYLNYQNPPQSVIGVYRWIPQLEAALLAEVNQDETLAAPRQAQLNNAIIALGAAGTAAIIGLLYANRLSRPIAQLTASANQFSRGDLKHRTDVTSTNEIGVLAQSFNSMAEQIEQRIIETQAALERAERADYADKVKSAFLASMSHELRTPLNAVINFTRFVVDGDTGPVNAEQIDLLSEVVKSATHLLALINDVLDMSKIEAGALVLFVEDGIDLTGILKSAMTTARSLIATKPILLETDIAADLPLIRADRQRILQVLMNIISNACKFTAKGNIILTAKPIGDEVVISISDTGTGIEPDDQAMVFQPFRQTKAGLRQGGGTGLGMPIAKSLVEAHYGRLWLESTPGEGTTFHLALPIKEKRLQPSLV